MAQNRALRSTSRNLSQGTDFWNDILSPIPGHDLPVWKVLSKWVQQLRLEEVGNRQRYFRICSIKYGCRHRVISSVYTIVRDRVHHADISSCHMT